MPRDWKQGYQRRLQKAASERGKRMVNARWAKERNAREQLAQRDPIQVGGKIVERWIRVIGETIVRERAIYEFDLPCDIRRKRRELFA